jgi:hypothetical protein
VNAAGRILPRACLVLAIVVTGVVTAAACAPARTVSYRPVEPIDGLPPLLTWLGEFTRPSGFAYPQIADSAKFGSLSGLVHDAQSGQWISVIDDRFGTRVAWLSIEFAGSRLEVSPTRMMPLRPGPGVPARAATQADLEAIAALPDGTFLMAEEGHRTLAGETWQPALLHVNRDGLVIGLSPFPADLQIAPDGKSGVRDNQGFESLTRTPGGRIITGLEQPLIEDGDTTFGRGGRSRLVEFVPRGRQWRAGKQWQYDLEPTPSVEGFPEVCAGGENGLVELLAITETMLIALERACLQDASGKDTVNPVRLYAVELIGAGTRKTLLLDLASLAPKLSPGMARLDNFEALAFGPLLGGQRSLLVVSDDNFRASQQTSFLLFGIR